MASRRKFVAGTVTALSAGLAGCSDAEQDVASLLGGEVESEELECEGVSEFEVRNYNQKAFEENNWVQKLKGGVSTEKITVNYNGEDAVFQYGPVTGIIDESFEGRGGVVHVGNYDNEEVFRYFRRVERNEDRMTLKTGLDRDGLGETDFGSYEQICQM